MKWRRHKSYRGDAGVTLVELLLTVSILAIAVVAIMGGLFTSIATSDSHRDQATVATLLRSYADSVQGAGYVSCASWSSYSSSYALPSGYAATAVVSYWDGNSAPAGWSTSCTANGLQRIQLTVSATDGRYSETLAFYKRKHQTGEQP